jgi:hypothetical protein
MTENTGYTPDPFLNALAERAGTVHRNLVAFLERNPDLSPGQRGRLVTLLGSLAPLKDVHHLEMLEDAWRG